MPDPQLRLADLQLKQLARMRDVGMRLLDDLDGERDLPVEQRMPIAQRAQSFEKIAKAVRQIMALEQEVAGLREKRVTLVATEQAKVRRSRVRHAVEKSLASAKPQLGPPQRGRLLHDLFIDYKKFANGSIPELIAGICKDLGIPADLTLWAESGVKDIVPVTGFVPASGGQGRPPDSPHFTNHGGAPPGG